ncbi:MAG: hypothetical protein WBO34_14940 [Gammaproteobacteria bacterium]
MNEMPESGSLTPWELLSADRQLELREAYGRHLDTLPPTCSLETKIQRFRSWLEARGIIYNG